MARRLKELKNSRSNVRRESNSQRKSRSSGPRSSTSERRGLLPLLERARVEVYLPDLPRAAYYNLLDELTQEFTIPLAAARLSKGSMVVISLRRARQSRI